MVPSKKIDVDWGGVGKRCGWKVLQGVSDCEKKWTGGPQWIELAVTEERLILEDFNRNFMRSRCSKQELGRCGL